MRGKRYEPPLTQLFRLHDHELQGMSLRSVKEEDRDRPDGPHFHKATNIPLAKPKMKAETLV